jgi:hypothetical protein
MVILEFYPFCLVFYHSYLYNLRNLPNQLYSSHLLALFFGGNLYRSNKGTKSNHKF